MFAQVRRYVDSRPSRRSGFSLAELLVVLGVVALLLAIVLPPLQAARRQAITTHCAAQQNQVGMALNNAHHEYGFYPHWDDGGKPIRFTWIDVLMQLRLLGASSAGGLPAAAKVDGRNAYQLGYCPADYMPDPLNEARHPDLAYPPNRSKSGIDYSYGIGLPLSAGGWVRQGAGSDPTDDRPRRFVDHESRPSERVLVGDAYESYIYNLSGNALRSNIWNDPTQFDNTVAWRRHTIGGPRRLGANVLFQDGHASIVEFHTDRPDPVNTARVFVWHPGESLNLNPDSRSGENYYPNRVPPSFLDGSGDVFPRELLPFWYSRTQGWTLIPHK